MMKKQMLFSLLMLGCVNAFASQETDNADEKKETALRIDLYGPIKNHGISTTGELNGIDIHDWIAGYDSVQMPDDKEVSIVEIGVNGEFLPVAKLSDLRRDELKKCHHAIWYTGSTFKYYDDKENRDEKHWNVVEQLKKGTCVLCDGTTIVTEARGDAREICAKLRAWQEATKTTEHGEDSNK